MRHLSIMSLVLFLFVGAAYSKQKTELTAQQIIDQMTSVYAACDSYADEGEVRTIFIQEIGNRTVIKPFSTAFVRPSSFRFEFKDRRGENEWNNYIIWKGADSVKTWWTIKPTIETPQDLRFAVAGAGGVSGGVSITIPSLLMAEVSMYNQFKRLSDLKLIGEDEINGNTAYKIEGINLSKNIITLWIDKKNLLIVKIFEKKKFEGKNFETETTITFKPQINVKIADDKLAFNIPDKAE